jgi:anti-anti-sigma factor
MLTVDVRDRLSPVVAYVAGEVDMSTAGRFQDLLRAAPDGDLVLDVAGVQFFSAAGLHVLLDEHERRAASGARLVLVEVPRCVDHLLLAAKVDMDSEPTVADALAALAQPSGRPGERLR